MPDARRELQTIRPASHTLLSVNCLYQMNVGLCNKKFTNLIPAPGRPLQRTLKRGGIAHYRSFCWWEACTVRRGSAFCGWDSSSREVHTGSVTPAERFIHSGHSSTFLATWSNWRFNHPGLSTTLHLR